MPERDYKIEFRSDIFLVKDIVSDALSFIMRIFPNLSEDSRFDFKLVLNELLLNAVSHGNKEDINKKVCLSLLTHKDYITITVTDEGEGFDYGSRSSDIEEEQLLSERGRGISLIKYLSDKISFNEKGNEIEICKNVDCD